MDLIFTINPSTFNRVETISGISDHDTVFAQIDTNILKNTQKPQSITLYSKANCDTIKEDMTTALKTITEMDENNNCTVDEMWECFKPNLENSVKQYVPQKVAKTKDGLPLIARELKKLIQKRNRLYKKKKSTIQKEEEIWRR